MENDEVWEIKQSDILKMKCQEKNDKNEELENDVAHVDVTHDHDGYKSWNIHDSNCVQKKGVTAVSRSQCAIDSNVLFLY